MNEKVVKSTKHYAEAQPTFSSQVSVLSLVNEALIVLNCQENCRGRKFVLEIIDVVKYNKGNDL